MKAGPARSIERTRNEYHHSVPRRSLSRAFQRRPNQIAGIVKMTGTNMMTRCKNLNVVARGSTIATSTNRQSPLHARLRPCTSSGSSFAISAIEASSIWSSGVLPSPLSSSLNATNAAGDNKLHMSILPLGGFGGVLKGIRHLEGSE